MIGNSVLNVDFAPHLVGNTGLGDAEPTRGLLLRPTAGPNVIRGELGPDAAVRFRRLSSACESALADIFILPRSRRMPRLVTIGRVGLCIYADDHMPPHFPVLTPDGDAQVRIDSLQLIRGLLRRADWETVIDWASETNNRQRLWAEWRRLNERG